MFPRRRAGVLVALMIAALSAMTPDAAAQQTEGRLRGVVVDSTGLPLPGVLVELEREGAVIDARTGADGRTS